MSSAPQRPPRPQPRSPFPRLVPAGRDVSRKGFAAREESAGSAQRPPCPGGDPSPRSHVVLRAVVVAAPSPPPSPRPARVRFKGRRRISWPRAQSPAGCLGAPGEGTAGSPRPHSFGPSSRAELKGQGRTLRLPAPTLALQTGSPPFSPKGNRPSLLAPSPVAVIPIDDHTFRQKKSWNLEDLSG